MKHFPVFAFFLVAAAIHGGDQQVTTVAGTGAAGYSGDGGPATSAQINLPSCVAVDTAGNIYISDGGNHRIRKVNEAGTITTVAGTGRAGYAGDGGPAISARLFAPGGVAVDDKGNIYIADTYNNRVREIDVRGIVITVAGTGASGYSGDGGAATSARLNGPSEVAVDKTGSLFITDARNFCIRKVDREGVIATVAGTGAAGFSGDGEVATSAKLNEPSGVAVDTTGNLYIADSINHRIRKVDKDGTITTVAGVGTAGYSGDGGLAMFANLSYPTGLAVDESGDVFIADSGNHCVRKVDTTGRITTVVGVGTAGSSGDGRTATSVKLNFPTSVAVDNAGNLYIADQSNNLIRKVSTP